MRIRIVRYMHILIMFVGLFCQFFWTSSHEDFSCDYYDDGNSLWFITFCIYQLYINCRYQVEPGVFQKADSDSDDLQIEGLSFEESIPKPSDSVPSTFRPTVGSTLSPGKLCYPLTLPVPHPGQLCHLLTLSHLQPCQLCYPVTLSHPGQLQCHLLTPPLPQPGQLCCLPTPPHPCPGLCHLFTPPCPLPVQVCHLLTPPHQFLYHLLTPPLIPYLEYLRLM